MAGPWNASTDAPSEKRHGGCAPAGLDGERGRRRPSPRDERRHEEQRGREATGSRVSDGMGEGARQGQRTRSREAARGAAAAPCAARAPSAGAAAGRRIDRLHLVRPAARRQRREARGGRREEAGGGRRQEARGGGGERRREARRRRRRRRRVGGLVPCCWARGSGRDATARGADRPAHPPAARSCGLEARQRQKLDGPPASPELTKGHG